MATPRRARPSNTFSIAVADGKYVLYHDCRRLLSQTELSPTVLRFLSEANRAAVDATAHFAVHSSVVGDDDRVIVVAADSGGGKSTLAAAFLQHGLRYGSDEALCLDDEGLVVPYPKPINLSPWSQEALGLVGESDQPETPFTHNDIGSRGVLETGRAPTDLLIPTFTDGDPGITAVPASTAVTTLIRLSFNHYKDGARSFRLATQLANSMRVWQLRVGTPVATASMVLETL